LMADQRIKFTLVGTPQAWHRPKLSRSNRIDQRGVRVFKDKRDVAYQTALGMEATSAMMLWAQSNRKAWDATGEWCVDVAFCVPDLRRRDIDNLAKSCLDALTGIVYDDDTQVTVLKATKSLNRSRAQTTVTVTRAYGHLTD